MVELAPYSYKDTKLARFKADEFRSALPIFTLEMHINSNLHGLMAKTASVLILAMLVGLQCTADDQIDSLKRVIAKAEDDTIKVNALAQLASKLSSVNPEQAKEYALKSLNLAKALSFDGGVAQGNYILGSAFYYIGDLKTAQKYFEKAGGLFKALHNEIRVAQCLNATGAVLVGQGKYQEGLIKYIESLKLKEKLNDKDGIASSYLNIGQVYAYQEQYTKCLEYYYKALKLSQEIGDKLSTSYALHNIGATYDVMGIQDSALVYYKNALKIKKELGDEHAIAYTLQNIGELYTNNDQLGQARTYLEESLRYFEKLGMKLNISGVLNSLAQVYRKSGDYERAIDMGNQALEIAEGLDSKDRLKLIYEGLAYIHADHGTFEEAYRYHRLYSATKDSLLNEENSKILNELEEQYQDEKKQLLIENLENEKQLQSTQLIGALNALGLALVLGFIAFRGYRNKKKANKIISQQKEEVEHQKEIVDEKNKEITDSIAYAKRIQNAILPPASFINQCLHQSFILFKPNDIISGHFYWVEQVDDRVYFAAVDCTGHGVPGAMVSVVGHNGLNRCVNEFSHTQPGKILDQLTQLVEGTFEKSAQEVKDGMDIALCCLSADRKTLEYSGANNPLYIISNGELTETKPDKQPIGAYDHRKSFSNHIIELKKDDTVYLFTDGFADQFGGDKGKKFKYKPFKQLLLSVHEKPMTEQQEILSNTIDEWRGDLEQIDDICVFGAKI